MGRLPPGLGVPLRPYYFCTNTAQHAMYLDAQYQILGGEGLGLG